ncbi:MBL fold metallo-hydrolase [Rhodococcus opacus]|uniref:MBL fold metallo-hydrolase n=1 Tax=Rhodococcus opacus TaxID=37919 RepID=UPI0024760390|nr:MBL fold metallo-hydrolase [Rhodococcus opacus]MDH6292853.1 N-acyl homoserine lactone hydrolase [Rhodococcus opacus]
MLTAARTDKGEGTMTEYSIWALEYVQLPDYPDSSLVYGAPGGSRLLPFYYFVLQRGDHVALVDAGFIDNAYGREKIDLHGMVGFADAGTVMARIGLTPEDVDDILVTHHHFDHVSGVDYFPNARVWIQQSEVASYKTKIGSPPRLEWLSYGLDPETGDSLDRIAAEGRLKLVEGVAEVFPGVEVRPAFDTHTAGSQYVVIDDVEGETPWVFPGDVACVYENLGGVDGKNPLIPVGLATGSQECCLRSTDEMLTVAHDDIDQVLPMHDVRIWERYPSVQHEDGLHVAEVHLARGVESRLNK